MTDSPAVSLAHGVRDTNSDPVLGLKSIAIDSTAINESQVHTFLDRLRAAVQGASVFDSSTNSQQIDSIAGSALNWQQQKYQLYPVYIERLRVVDEAVETNVGIQGVRVAAGEWIISFGALNDPVLPATIIEVAASSPTITGGLAVNVLSVSRELLTGDYDIRPLVLHALAPDGSACDKGKPKAQAAISNAFWQTFWATGARRAERGNVFPVAFLPVDRTWAGEFQPPFRERYVSLRRRIFGRSSILAFIYEVLTRQHVLYFDPESNRFVVLSGFDASQHNLADDDIALALSELNRTGFVDAFTGENAGLFANWAAAESEHASAPFTPDARSPKSAYVSPTDRYIRIYRVVPYSGCAFLNEVVNASDELIACGKIQALNGSILAATNSTFFLNFPEEYATLHSAMNDAVALLVENGRTIQTKTMRRATFVLSETGEPAITTRAGIRLNSEVLIFEGESASTSYFDNAHRSFAKNHFGPLFFGSVVVGNSIVETFEESSTEVPANGWITGDSEAFGGEIDPTNAISAQIPGPTGIAEIPVRHAFAVGPLLLQAGEVVPLGESGEQFQPIVLKEPPSFEESRECTRAQVPPTLLKCEKRGVPPTRFPYDWDHTRAPRTAIGITADGTVHLVVVDGRADLAHSVGATLAELAQVMKNLGCTDAMNMDGGGSSVMFINDPRATKYKMRPELRDGVVNLPSDLGGVERLLPVPLVITRKNSQ